VQGGGQDGGAFQLSPAFTMTSTADEYREHSCVDLHVCMRPCASSWEACASYTEPCYRGAR